MMSLPVQSAWIPCPNMICLQGCDNVYVMQCLLLLYEKKMCFLMIILPKLQLKWNQEGRQQDFVFMFFFFFFGKGTHRWFMTDFFFLFCVVMDSSYRVFFFLWIKLMFSIFNNWLHAFSFIVKRHTTWFLKHNICSQ